jgi:hypothetical protein
MRIIRWAILAAAVCVLATPGAFGQADAQSNLRRIDVGDGSEVYEADFDREPELQLAETPSPAPENRQTPAVTASVRHIRAQHPAVVQSVRHQHVPARPASYDGLGCCGHAAPAYEPTCGVVAGCGAPACCDNCCQTRCCRQGLFTGLRGLFACRSSCHSHCGRGHSCGHSAGPSCACHQTCACHDRGCRCGLNLFGWLKSRRACRNVCGCHQCGHGCHGGCEVGCGHFGGGYGGETVLPPAIAPPAPLNNGSPSDPPRPMVP